MKPPTKPPPPPVPPSNLGRNGDDPTSGRARKDVAYTPSQGMPAVGPASVRSVSPMRAPPPPPAPPTPPPEPEPYDMLEDLATPTPPARSLARFSAPSTNLQTGPMPQLPMPPPSSRGLGPPSSRGSDYGPPPSVRALDSRADYAPPPMSASQPMMAPSATPPPFYPPSQNLAAASQNITGPQLPPPNAGPPFRTGSYPTGSGAVPAPAPSSRTTGPGLPPPEPGMPIAYVVASAFFLAIALVGFGLYLAFEVISL